jgi:hypothetical protein
VSVFPPSIFGDMYGRTPGDSVGGAMDASHAAAKAREADRRADEVENRMDRLLLACAAMWSLLQEVTDLTEKDLQERMRELDLTDGRLDGKIVRTPVQCIVCHRPMSPRHVRCIWCGSEKVRASGFDDAK